MDHTSPDDMVIRAGPGKELKITKDTVRLILGLPSAGGGLEHINWKGRVNAATKFRNELGIGRGAIKIETLQNRIADGGIDDLTMRCFFIVFFNRLLFPQASWDVTNQDIELTEDITNFSDIDRCQLIFNNLCDSVQSWHDQKDNHVSRTIYGCSVVILLYYLDHLDHPSSPDNKYGTPHISFYNRVIIKELVKADWRHARDGIETFGRCHLVTDMVCCFVSSCLGQLYKYNICATPEELAKK
ncbi:hypothetical protein BS78_06G041000 [Paspalum vaginatum]|nr:hypothetical protein BS78_06G041000 [Paspalum vaginatum]